MIDITFNQAIKDTISYELRRNRNCVLISQDLEYLGEHKVSRGYDVMLPHNRIIDVPCSEDTYTTMAIGLAMSGFNVILELKASELLRCIDPIVNYAAKLNLVYDDLKFGSLLIRVSIGYEPFVSPQESEYIEAALCHYPGLKVVFPSNTTDAVKCIKGAFLEKHPVILFEEKSLKKKRFNYEATEEVLEFSSANVMRLGEDVSVITYGDMANTAMRVASELQGEGINVEIVDLRTIYPIDKEAIFESVEKTGRAVVLHKGNKSGGIGSEICAIISQGECFDYLQSPIKEICLNDTFIPYSDKKASEILPSEEKIAKAIRDIVNY